MALLSPIYKPQTVTAKRLAVKKQSRPGRTNSPIRRRPNRVAIKVRLAELELSVAGLARRLGWTRVYVSMLIHGDRVTPAAQRRIAAALRMPVDRAFPRKP